MAVTGANLAAPQSGSNATSYASASIAPGGNRLLLLTVESSLPSGGNPSQPTVTGNGLTWVNIDSKTIGSLRRVSLFRAMGASPSSGAVTVDFAAETQDGCGFSVDEFDGVDTSGTNGSGAVVQALHNSANSTSMTVTLAAFSDAANATFGGCAQNINATFTQDSGWTLLTDAGHTSPNSHIGTQWIASNDTSVVFTFGSTGTISGWGVELKAAAAAAGFSGWGIPI